ncbi:unnamed protein product [Agarophyton chilense]|eukprot:gb/GEZJ01003381.1/.p1 GENE.gb/GEZJ01003381.1/~~gb/GEZJ01003381.1/.p1  ORF type:complete len:210 (-),score=16.65 gb/GEZJ01003381.1/:675-1304(-)
MRTAVLFLIVYAFLVPHISADNRSQTISKLTAANVNICFALDGSSSISPSWYRTQKSVVNQVVNAIPHGNKMGLAAAQYGISVTTISPFTVDHDKFLSSLRSSVQLESNRKFVTAGLNYCISELSESHASRNLIVLFGDGNSSVGRDPGHRSAFFFRRGGVVFAVGVGESQNITELMNIAGNDSRRFFSINANYSDGDASADLSKLLFF